MNELRPYQRSTIEFIRTHPRCAVTSAAGTGKTRCAIESWEDTDRILVICPAHLRETWAREIHKWRPYFIPMVTIKSYDYFARLKTKVTLPYYTCCVVDESTYLKSWTAKRTQIICSLVLPKIPRVIFMSASPLQKSALDIHPTLSVIDREMLSEGQFAERYCNRTYDHFRGVVFSGVKTENALELKSIWEKTSIKFTKQDVASELPPIVEDITYVHSNHRPNYDPATLDYEHVTAEMKSEYQVVGMEKVPYIIDLVDTTPNEPTLVFCHHRRVNEELTAALEKIGRKVGQILGGDSKKDEKVISFMEGKIDYLVISMEAGGTGLNLPRASRVIFAELPWTYVTYYQCMNRAHRLNTEHTVYVHSFVLSGTLDEGLLRTIQEKKGYSDAVVGEIDNTIKKENYNDREKIEHTCTTDKTITDTCARNISDPCGECSTVEDAKRRIPRKSSRRTTSKNKKEKQDSGRDISSGSLRSGDGKGWGSVGTTNGNITSRRYSDPLGIGIDDLGLGLGRTSNPREEEPQRQGTRSPSTECSDFLDELCGSTILK